MSRDYYTGLAIAWVARVVLVAGGVAIVATLSACDHTLNLSSSGTLTKDGQVSVPSTKPLM